MEIRNATEQDLEQFAKILKETFSVHTIFEKSGKEIVTHLKKQQNETAKGGGGFIVAVEGSKVIGGLLIEKKNETHNHSLWKYKYVAVEKNSRNKGVGTRLLEEAEKRIKELIYNGKIATAKVELTIAENEKDAIGFYEKNGFVIEGTFDNHYRWNEKTFAMGKSLTIQR